MFIGTQSMYPLLPVSTGSSLFIVVVVEVRGRCRQSARRRWGREEEVEEEFIQNHTRERRDS